MKSYLPESVRESVRQPHNDRWTSTIGSAAAVVTVESVALYTIVLTLGTTVGREGLSSRRVGVTHD